MNTQETSNGYDGPNIKDQSVFVASVNHEMLYADFIDALFKHDTQDMEHMHAALGITGEAGEIADAIKKAVVYGKELDRANIVEELGDLRFYMQQLMNMHGITEEEVLQGNANKLSKRYPTGGYSNADAIARADKVEDPSQDFTNYWPEGTVAEVKKSVEASADKHLDPKPDNEHLGHGS